MTEFAVFNAEGCLERGFYTRADAEVAAMRERVAGDVDAYADELCPEHEDDEQPRATCEECATDGAEVDGREHVECRCVESCADDPDTACSLSGIPHVHPDDGSDTFGACPVHPDAPGDL